MSKLSDEIGQFASVPHTVIKMCAAITADGLALFTYLRYRTNSETGDAFPSYDTIQKDTGMSRRRIARALRALIDAGVATRKRRYGNSTIYTLVMPRPISSSVQPMEIASSSSVTLSLVAERHTTKTESIKTEKKDYYPLASALAEVCRMELGANKAELFAEAKRLSKDAADVLAHYGPGGWWYAEDWRGQKGQPPRPADVRRTWGQWSKTAAPAAITPEVSPRATRQQAGNGWPGM